MKELNNYYVYAHANAITGTIFYIGKGKGLRAKSLHRRSERWHNYVNKYGYKIIYIEENLTQEQSFLAEVHYIKYIGRKDLATGELINMSDGGVGGNNNKGRVFSEEWRRKISEAGRGRIGIMRGKKHPDETKKKISEKLIGRPATWLKGKKISEEVISNRMAKRAKRTCQYCGINTDIGAFAKYHGEKCKKHPNYIKPKKILTDNLIMKKLWYRYDRTFLKENYHIVISHRNKLLERNPDKYAHP